MATAKKSKAPAKAKAALGPRRFWLMYPPRLITTPVIWQLAQKFPVVTNVRQASITDEIGVVCLELDGKADDIEAAWTELPTPHCSMDSAQPASTRHPRTKWCSLYS